MHFRLKPTVGVSLGLACIVAMFGSGCPTTGGGVGDPCTPDKEFDPKFSGFSLKEASVESKSFQCQSRVCLVNHFRGRVSCGEGNAENKRGLGQDKDGNGPGGAEGCTVPGTDIPVTGPLLRDGSPVDARKGRCVQAWCKKRQPKDAVYCSCRCENADGRKDDGEVYCNCPDSFVCAQLVSPIGTGNEFLTGGYCVKKGTEYDQNQDNCGATVENRVSDCPD
jgi:hypothetical protein